MGDDMRPCPGCGKPKRRAREGGALLCIKCASIFERIKGRAAHPVWRAIRNGWLPHPKRVICRDCGKRAHGYDHRWYSRPLAVEAVCRSCNGRRRQAHDWLRLVRQELRRSA